MRNDHIWWSICFRRHHTSYGDLALAFFESLIGFIAMKFIEDCVGQHKRISGDDIEVELQDKYQRKVNPNADLLFILTVGEKDVACRVGLFDDDDIT